MTLSLILRHVLFDNEMSHYVAEIYTAKSYKKPYINQYMHFATAAT